MGVGDMKLRPLLEALKGRRTMPQGIVCHGHVRWTLETLLPPLAADLRACVGLAAPFLAPPAVALAAVLGGIMG